MAAKKRYVLSYRKLPEGVRREIIRQAAAGSLQRDIARRLGVSQQVISTILAPMGWVIRVEDWKVSRARLSLDERIEIALGRQGGESLRSIARRLGRDPSTIRREVKRGRVDRKHGYRPVPAHKLAYKRARRPKQTKLSGNPELRRRVIRDLENLWSPQQISKRLQGDFGDDTTMQISHETIYKSIYVQGRGELRRELARCLRTGRAHRRPRGWNGTRRRMIPNMVMIADRPGEAADRAVPGHWEGDLLMGRDNKTALGTLVERTTRFTLLLPLPVDHTAPSVRNAMAKAVVKLPQSLRRSITWDQGPELAQHVQFTVDTGVQVYFCDPHSPWQRGSNENTNGLLRQYFPKGTDIVHNARQLQKVADSLNGRPRQTLNWRTPAEKFAELVATIT